MIFNSLGSNYSFDFAWKFLRAQTSINDDERLKQFLAEKYGGQSWLYYRGRAALSEAVRLCEADYVLINSFGCYAVEQAVQAAGSRSDFADIEKETFHFSLKQLESTHQANPQIKSVIVQNTFGIGIEIKPILSYCQKHKLYLIEDLAHCPANRYADGLEFGQVGDMVVLSFGRDKQIDTVNGGALIIRNQILAEKVVAPQPVFSHWRQRFLDRLYPFLICLMRLCYRNSFFGKTCHWVFKSVGLLSLANDGPLLRNGALPSYRSGFVLKQFKDIETDQKRRRQLSAIYAEKLLNRSPLVTNQPLLRYPILLSSKNVRTMMLKHLARHKIYLNDTWYDGSVYPLKFSKLSSYQEGSCEQKEKVTRRVANLPLHRNMTVATTRHLAKIAGLYDSLHFKTKFDFKAWLDAWQKFNPINSNLLTSWEEAEAYRLDEQKVWRLGVYKNGQPIALMIAVLIEARRGRFLKVAGGPLFKTQDIEQQKLTIEKLKAIALKEKCSFVRMQPYLLDTPENRHFMKALKLKVSPVNLNAPNTLKVDLLQPSEKILGSKHYKNTRYYINLAKRFNLRVERDDTPEALEEFLKLLKRTQQNQGFLSNSFSFIRSQLKAYAKLKKIHLYRVLNAADADNPNEILAGAVIIDSGGEAAYLYGASSVDGQKLKAPYILQWQIILDAQARGLKTYNLWGIAPQDAKTNHRFIGLTRFKKNFSSKRYEFLPSYDLILNKWRYLPVYLLDTYETKRRHL